VNAAIKRYLSSFEHPWSDEAPVRTVRFLSVDTESTGIDPSHDFLVAYGAVAVTAGEIRLDDTFEAMVRRPFNDANVTLHGITRERSLSGDAPDLAFANFLDYIRNGVLVGHHIEYDISMLNAAGDRYFGVRLCNRWVDTMALALHLEKDGVLEPQNSHGDFSLDGLCARFHIAPHDRHTASGDAFLTAQVFLKLLPYARRAGRNTLSQLSQKWEP